MSSTVVLIILDGWGYREERKDNAIAEAHTPYFDQLWQQYPHTLLEASGEYVGLPEGQIGNSEIGHTTIGAGTILDTDLVKINKAIKSGDFKKNSVFQGLFAHVLENRSTLHVMGLLSNGGIHSHAEHLEAFLQAAKEAGVQKVAVHVFSDGRDTPPRSAAESLRELEQSLAEKGIGRIVSVSGRYYAMDRDKNWDRLAKFEEAVFAGKAPLYQIAPSKAVEELYRDGKVDEHLLPMLFPDAQGELALVQPADAIFIFNYRSDRVRMLTEALLKRLAGQKVLLASMTEYNPEYNSEVAVAFPPSLVETTLGAEVAKAGLTQAHIAESEKFPHATYFLNGGRQDPHPGEEQVLLESRKDIVTHDQAPEMRAEAIADEAIKRIEQAVPFIFINFANPDMVGHTGNQPAIIQALEEVDRQLGRVVEAVKKKGGVAVITADHGNAELNVDPESGEKHTAHTLFPVPCIVVGKECALHRGSLADLAPTVLELLALPKPLAMTGNSLLNNLISKHATS